MTSHAERAMALFEQGYNCAQATVAAFADDFRLDVTLVMKMVAGLGGGRGGQRETCGAVSAMAIIAGLRAGAYSPGDQRAKRALYARIRDMEREFAHVHESTCCRELLRRAGIVATSEPSERTPEYCAVRPCARFVATAARIASKTLGEAADQGVSGSADCWEPGFFRLGALATVSAGFAWASGLLTGRPEARGAVPRPIRTPRHLMQVSHEVAQMLCLRSGPNNGPAPIPEEGRWVQAREVKDISGLTHGVGWCAPQQGACKLTLNVKDGKIEEALVETIGCTGMTHSAAMAAEILPGKTILEALNVDLVCDAINVAMRELFLQIVYGRTQTAFSEGGLPIGAAREDLGKGLRSVTGTMFGTTKKGPRYLEMAEGYVTRLALDENEEIIGYEFVKLGPMLEMISDGKHPAEAVKKCTGSYGRFAEAKRIINPRKE